MIAILGAGISGISAGYHLKKAGKESVIFEKDDQWGGLCGNFTVDGFRFDKAIHLSFTDNEYVKGLFADASDYITHKPESYNYYKGCWIKHPVQNNLYPLSSELKISIIKDFINNKYDGQEPENYEEWLRFQYGDFFAENFPIPYTRKYWVLEAIDLSVSWVGKRMHKPNIEEVLYGAFNSETQNHYYAKEMRYPVKHGYKYFLHRMASECNIRLNKKAIKIDTDNKEIYFDDGEIFKYTELISSIPLPEYTKLIDNIPADVASAAENLKCTQVGLVSIGLKRKDIPKHLWFYVYDEDFEPARCNSPSYKSPDNAPEGMSSLQFEIYYLENYREKKNTDQEIIDDIVNRAVEMGIFKSEDVAAADFRILEYGNVVFYKKMEEDREKVLSFLKRRNIHPVGRFGKWEYLWSDQSLLSGIDVAANLTEAK